MKNNYDDYEFYDNNQSVVLYSGGSEGQKRKSSLDPKLEEIVNEMESDEISHQRWKKYKLARDRERFWGSVKKGLKIERLKRTAITTYVLGSLIALTVISGASLYRDGVEEYASKNLKDKPYVSVQEAWNRTGYSINNPVFTVGTSMEIPLINTLINGTQTGDMIKYACSKYGVDSSVFASIYVYESGFAVKNVTYDDIDKRVKEFRDDMDEITFEMYRKYGTCSEIDKAILFCTIQSQNYGVDAVKYIINNYDLISDNKFSYSNFIYGVRKIYENPKLVYSDYDFDTFGDPNYIDTIMSGVLTPDVSFVINYYYPTSSGTYQFISSDDKGMSRGVKYCLENDWDHLIVDRFETRKEPYGKTI